MKKIVLMMVAIFTMSIAQAQTETTEVKKEKKEMRRGGKRMDMTEMMKTRYGLTDAQAEQVKALNEEYKDLMRPGRGRGPRGIGRDGKKNNQKVEQNTDGATGATTQAQPSLPSKEEIQKRMAERKAKQAEYDNKLKEIMNAEQFAKYQEDQNKRMGGHRGHRNNDKKD